MCREMHSPHRINLTESKAEMMRRLGLERSKHYFYVLNRFLSLKLNKAEFNKICRGIVGRDNIPLHNQIIHSILRNALTAKLSPPTDATTRAVGNNSDVYQNNGPHAAVNQLPNPPAFSNGDILPLSPKKARTGNRDRRVWDRRSAFGLNGQANYLSQQPPLATQSGDYNPILENGESIPPDTKTAVQHHHQGLEQQVENPAKLSTVSGIGTGSVCSTDLSKFLVKKDGKEEPARRSLCPPLGIPFCTASSGGARKASPLASNSKLVSAFDLSDLLDTTMLKQHMEHIATTQGLEGVPMDCVNMLNNGLDAYLKGLVRSCLELVGARSGLGPAYNCPHKQQAYSKLINGFRPGHRYQMQHSSRPLDVIHQRRPCCPISLLDFKVAMELNPHQLGDDWPLLLEKICTHSFEEET